MDELELPNGETVTPDDVFLYGGYPYRFRPGDDYAAFYFSPLYWGGGEMDVPFRTREALVEQWGEDGQATGPLSTAEWEAWLDEARGNDQFDAEELDHIAREVGVEGATDGTDEDESLLDKLMGRFR